MPVTSHIGCTEVDTAALARLAASSGVLLDAAMAALTEVAPAVYAGQGPDWNLTRDAVGETFHRMLAWAGGDVEPEDDAMRLLVEPGRRKGRHRLPRAQLLESVGALEKAMSHVLWARTDVRDVPTLRAVAGVMRDQGPRLADLLLSGYEQGLAEHGHLADLKTAVCRSWLDGRLSVAGAQGLGLPTTTPWLVLVREHGHGGAPAATAMLHRVLRSARHVLGVLHGECFVLVAPYDGGDPAGGGRDVLATLGPDDPAGEAVCGVALATTPGGVSAAWQEATVIRDLAVAARDPRAVVTAADVALERMLAGSAQRVALTSVLDRLGPELRRTLEMLYQSNIDKQATARTLHVHRNTLDYRLRQIERLTGVSPTSVRGIQLLASALTLHRLAPDSQ
ncbi:PucR family transcriptional regulator [Micromonospora sp. BQ11]|uniref:PucR family transcriptional regulator n=1 Tax=Micromonospora sp. BQ11 TaxID=3452212 RepID=UPI003F89B754